MMKKITTILYSALLTVLLGGCASELSENETIDRIRSELQRAPNPLYIHENNALGNSNVGAVYGNKQNPQKQSLPVFEYEKASGGVVNNNARRPQRPATNQPGTVTLNFENADLREVVKFIMTDLLKRNYMLSPAVNGQVTLQTSKPIAVNDLLPTLENLLKVNGAVIVDDGELLRIVPVAEANRGNLAPKVGKIGRLKPGYEVRIIPLKYLSAVEAQKVLEPFLPAGSLLQVDTVKNILTLAGTSNELANIQQTIDTFDVDWLKGMSIGIYRLQNVGLDEVLPEIEGLFGQGGSTPFAGLFQFIPMDRMNALMVITRQESYLHEASRWLEKLDQTSNSDQERLYVYRVQNGRAEDLAGVLEGIFSDSKKSASKTKNRDASVAPGQQAVSVSKDKNNKVVVSAEKSKRAKETPNKEAAAKTTARGMTISGAEATISADEVNNSLVIKATPANYDLVLQALRQLDVPKLQVMLDVVVAEIQLTGSLSLGFKYWLQEKDIRGKDSEVVSDSIRGGSFGLSGFSYTLNNLIPGRLNVAINALAENGLAQFLSTPSLMVLDNETATMNVGEKISISDNYTDANGVQVNGTSYLDTGVQLNITPRVTAGGNVQMNVTQSVSRQSKSKAGAQGNPNIYTRDIDSVVVANDGQTIVLGGLIQESNNSTRTGVPLLKDLPGVGPLFRTTGRNRNRTELIVLITPHVARNAGDTLRITKEFRKRMKGLDIYNESREKYH